MRISDWSSDVCSSDLAYEGNLETYVMNVLRDLSKEGGAMPQASVERTSVNGVPAAFAQVRANSGSSQVDVTVFAYAPSTSKADRKSVVLGKSVYVRVVLGCRRSIKKQHT